MKKKYLNNIKSRTSCQSLLGQYKDARVEKRVENAFVDLKSELLEENEKVSNLKCLHRLKSLFAAIEKNLRY
jgi:hypothetical protein